MMMNPASISALAAIFGSIVGALGSGASTWVTQRFQERREFLNKKFAQREQLYSDFISETAKAMLDASEHSLQDPGKLIPTYALLSRIRLSSSAKVIESAEKVPPAPALPHISQLIEDGEITIGMLRCIGCVATAADEDCTYVC